MLGYEECALGQLAERPLNSKSFTQYHVDGSFVSVQARADSRVYLKIREVAHEGLVTVIPLRSPVAAAISRTKNGGGHTVPQVRSMWGRLAETIDSFDHILLPVEAPWFDHRRLLALVDKKLGTLPVDYDRLEQVVHEWPKVGSSGVKKERAEYDRTGRTTLGDHDSSIFDENTAWYIQRLADFAGGEYMGRQEKP